MGCLKLTYYDEGVRLRPGVLNNPVRYIDPDGREPEDGGIIEKVGTFEGVPVYIVKGLPGGAVALPGIGIFINKDYYDRMSSSKRNELSKHEFGHILQFREMGPHYYTAVAYLSLYSATLETIGILPEGSHNNMPWERDADRRSERYFSRRSNVGNYTESEWENGDYTWFNQADNTRMNMPHFIIQVAH